jgi:hypothetical protein
MRMPAAPPLTTSSTGVRRELTSTGPGAQAGMPAPPIVDEALRSAGQPLDPATRAFMEHRIGRDFSQVRIHSGAVAGVSSEAVNAEAYTVGHDIVLGEGRFAPHTCEGRRLLAHELTHVAQQTPNSASPDSEAGDSSSVTKAAVGLARQPSPVTPMTAAHAGGTMGEVDAAFALGQKGFDIIIGPAGPGGHKLTERGLDIVAYNLKDDVLWVVDNKASGGTSTVRSASAITKNLETNLKTALKEVKALPDFPNKARIVQHLESSVEALEKGKALPGEVRLVITNAGGYHSGISGSLKKQGILFEDFTGSAVRDARKRDIAAAKAAGVRPGRPVTHAPEPPAAAEKPPVSGKSPAPPAAAEERVVSTEAKAARAAESVSHFEMPRIAVLDAVMFYLDIHAAHFAALEKVSERVEIAKDLLSRVEEFEIGAKELSKAVEALRSAEAGLPSDPAELLSERLNTADDLANVKAYWKAAAEIMFQAGTARNHLYQIIQGWDAALAQANETNDFTRKSAFDAVTELELHFKGGFRAFLEDARVTANNVEKWANYKRAVAYEMLVAAGVSRTD